MFSSSSEQHRPQKRKRTVISCAECHRRKQKCDRQYPCLNCVKRGKQNLCFYSAEPNDYPFTTHSTETSTGTDTIKPSPSARPGPELANGLQDQIKGLGYSSRGNYNSMSLLRSAELHEGENTEFGSLNISNQTQFPGHVGRKYKQLVRQLPSQACVDILIQTFFSDFNWQYDLLDEQSFREQLQIWGEVSYSALETGFDRLAPETLVFPALLFQVLAQALLVHSPHDILIGSLMNMADMAFHDLAAEYSDTGADLLALLGKRDIAIATIQAGLLRASFLKSEGKVIEAWHALGATIRDAQEIGLHTRRVASEKSLLDSESPRQDSTTIGHKIWVVLHIWDVHMAVVLGRPIATVLQIENFAITIEDEGERRSLFSHWQTETDPPRPFDVILAGYNTAYRYFQDIHRLESNGAKPEDYATVESIHAAVKKNCENLPSWCCLENPDPKFDETPGYQWLPFAREGLFSLIHLVLLTLHRPYIFSVTKSRREALHAGMAILRAQERLFQLLKLYQCKTFGTVYASFDAIVLIAAICLAFPNENHGLQAESLQAMKRGMQRLGIIAQSNSMAKSAHGVVWRLYRRIQQRLGLSEWDESLEPSMETSEWTQANGQVYVNIESPFDLSFDDILPPRPTHDLFYNHISVTELPSLETPGSLPLDTLPVDFTDNEEFEDVFDASFWDLMKDSHN